MNPEIGPEISGAQETVDHMLLRQDIFNKLEPLDKEVFGQYTQRISFLLLRKA